MGNNYDAMKEQYMKEMEKLLHIISLQMSANDTVQDLYDFIREDMDATEERQLLNEEDHKLVLNWLREDCYVEIGEIGIYEKMYLKHKLEFEEWENTVEQRKEQWARLGNGIKESRINAGITQEQLADMTWYTVADINHLENGGEYDKRMLLSLSNTIELHKRKNEEVTRNQGMLH